MVTIAVVVVLVFAILVTASSFHGVSTKVHTRPVMTMLFGSKVDTSAVPGETIIGSSDNRMDIRRTAEFLTYAMYDNMPRGQRRELLELESRIFEIDMKRRSAEGVCPVHLSSLRKTKRLLVVWVWTVR